VDESLDWALFIAARSATKVSNRPYLISGGRRYLSIAQHDHAIEQLGELGRMIGGWLRSTRDA
jgi:hypothetical protein